MAWARHFKYRLPVLPAGSDSAQLAGLFTEGSLRQVHTLGTFCCGSLTANRHPENVEVTDSVTQRQFAEGD